MSTVETTSLDEIEDLCKSIQNPERLVRQNALKKFHHLVQNAEMEANEMVEYFDIAYLYILKCYSDKYEMCRSLACRIINEMVDKLPNNEYYLECVLPSITRRIGQPELIEESEELRLDLMDQLYNMVEKYKTVEIDGDEDRLLKSYNNVIDILLKTLRDPFPAVQKKACNLIVLFSSEKCFHYRAEILATPLIDMLRHRHFSNRIAAIEALAYVSLNIHTNGECLMRIITEISPLLMDNMAHVRRECGRAGCLMLLKLRDRYSFFDKLLPLVLCCLSDEHDEVVNDIESRWIKCGELYYEENENELSKQITIDDLPESYSPDKRPTFGCRAIVQRSLKIIDVILREMEDWKDEVRLHSTRLLDQVVLHCEKAMTAKTLEIIPVLAKTCMDSVPLISTEAMRVANIMGQILCHDDWVSYALDELNTRPNIGNIRCITYLYSGSGKARTQDLEKICNAIVESRIIFTIKRDYTFRELYSLLDIMLGDYQEYKGSSGDQNEKLEKIFYQLIMNVIGISIADLIFTNKESETILLKLNPKIEDLHKKYLSGLVEGIEGLDCLNEGESEPILLLDGYLQFTGFHTYNIKSMENALKLVLDNAQPDAKIRILTGISIAMLCWNVKSETSVIESTEMLQSFIEVLLIPCLTWSVGRSCEAIRSMATACLCSISENAVEESYVIFPKIIENIIPLIEDNNIATRNYAVRSLLACGAIPSSDIKKTTIAVVSRLDDPSPDVRHNAAAVLGKIKSEDEDEWKHSFINIFSVAVHHLDDPDVRLKETLFNSLFEMARRHENYFNELIQSPKFAKFKKLEDIKQKLVANPE